MRRNTPPQSADHDHAAAALQFLNTAVISLDLLYEAAAGGHAGAMEELRDLAERIAARADDWRQMNYLKNGGQK